MGRNTVARCWRVAMRLGGGQAKKTAATGAAGKGSKSANQGPSRLEVFFSHLGGANPTDRRHLHSRRGSAAHEPRESLRFLRPGRPHRSHRLLARFGDPEKKLTLRSHLPPLRFPPQPRRSRAGQQRDNLLCSSATPRPARCRRAALPPGFHTWTPCEESSPAAQERRAKRAHGVDRLGCPRSHTPFLRIENPGPGIRSSETATLRTRNPGPGIFRSHSEHSRNWFANRDFWTRAPEPEVAALKVRLPARRFTRLACTKAAPTP